jgi:hypothetical protein
MEAPQLKCPNCKASFDYTAKFCAACRTPLELPKALCDLEYGEFDTQIRSIIEIARLDKSKLEDLTPKAHAVFDGIGETELISGALLLAKSGISLDPAVSILVKELYSKGLAPGQENFVEALSCIKGNTKVIRAMTSLAQYEVSEERQARPLWALGAIGDPSTRGFVEYWASRGRPAAKVALKLFGTGTFQMIKEEHKRIAKLHW